MFLVHLILLTIILGKKYPFVPRFRFKISFINGVMREHDYFKYSGFEAIKNVKGN